MRCPARPHQPSYPVGPSRRPGRSAPHSLATRSLPSAAAVSLRGPRSRCVTRRRNALRAALRDALCDVLSHRTAPHHGVPALNGTELDGTAEQLSSVQFVPASQPSSLLHLAEYAGSTTLVAHGALFHVHVRHASRSHSSVQFGQSVLEHTGASRGMHVSRADLIHFISSTFHFRHLSFPSHFISITSFAIRSLSCRSDFRSDFMAGVGLAAAVGCVAAGDRRLLRT